MKFIKENLRLIIAVSIALILIITGVILLNINKDKEDDKQTPPTTEENREEQLVSATGMTKEDAIEIVKLNFGSDNYTFDANATNDGLYKVVVTNTVDESKLVYFVDPVTGNAYIDIGAN